MKYQVSADSKKRARQFKVENKDHIREKNEILRSNRCVPIPLPKHKRTRGNSRRSAIREYL